MVAVVVVVFAIIMLSKLVRIVPQGWEWTVERWGKYTHTLGPGFHLLIPVMQDVDRKINMMEQVFDASSQDVISRDNAVQEVDGCGSGRSCRPGSPASRRIPFVQRDAARVQSAARKAARSLFWAALKPMVKRVS